jgi:hypothetical protein
MIDRAKMIYLNALRYTKASRVLNQKVQEGDIELFLPSMVNAALALELYFKVLYYIENGSDFKLQGRYSHNFSCLYKKLSDSIRKELAPHFEELIKTRDMIDVETIEKASSVQIPRVLKANLDAWSEVFVNIRYIYDSEGKAIPMMFFPEIEQSVLLVIYKLKPQWKP